MNDYELEIGTLSHVGTERDHNEDFCGSFMESNDRAVVVVADGVSSNAGGEVASRMAVEVTLRAFREEPQKLAAGQRLYRAVQQANIEVHDRSIAVPELRGMATTLTAVTVDRGALTAVHVGDSRLYLVRAGTVAQLSKDHTAAADKVRYGLLSKERARHHPDRSTLTRSLGRELIVSRDRVSQRVVRGDALLLCSDGLYNVLEDAEMAEVMADLDAVAAARALVEAANRRGTADNLTAAVVRMVGPTPHPPGESGIGAWVKRLLRRPGAPGDPT
ncbi:MAG TPA: protein phosphatase 2C domain-containing protein [Anaeromyxobacteraceae bacterium]|nr:protein phosphatase 2C domain-containing protein [Anaeromyxobacteraceae bacterium]